MKRLRCAMLIVLSFALMTFGTQTIIASETGTTAAGFKWTYEEGVMAITGYTGSATTVSIPSSINGYAVTRIHSDAFEWNNNIVKVVIPNTVTAIGAYAFYYCENLSSVYIPDSVTEIGSWAFRGCEALSSLRLSNSITKLSGAFGYCTSLKSVTIPNSVTELYDFEECTGLTSVTIPGSVTKLGGFSGCTGLTSITIPNSVKSINGFYGCTGIKSVTIPKTVKRINYKSFGYYTDSLSQERKISNFIMYGYYGTAAEAYASENSLTFSGSQNNIADIAEIKTISVSEYMYTGSAMEPKVTVSYLSDDEYGYPFGYDNTELAEGTDYTVSYSNNINAGTATVIANGINRYTGTVTKTFTIKPQDLVINIIFDKIEYNYTGSQIKPKVTVTTGSDNKVLAEGTDYTVTYNNNINVGKGTVTITGINNYSSSTTVPFDIVKASNSDSKSKEKVTISQKVSSVKTKVKKNKVTITWKKIKNNKAGKKLLKQIKSIQVQYSTDKKFKKNVSTKSVKKNQTKTTVTLKRKKTYYIRVRYKGSKGASKWSGVKRVKTK